MSAPVVLITGCSVGGIGHGLAEEFAARGCTVYASARKVEKMAGLPDSVHRVRMDVLSDASVAEAVGTVINEQGKIDVVVNNAGMSRVGALLDIPLEHVEQVFGTNVLSIIRVTQAVAPHMITRRRGLVMNVGSVAGMLPTPWSGTYAASKHAVHALSHVLEMELAPFGVNVMLVAPGSVSTHLGTNSAGAFVPREGSAYKDYTEAVVARAMFSHTARGAMSVRDFARVVVGKALKKSPPFFVCIAPPAGLFKVLVWFPMVVVRWLFTRRFMWKNKTRAA